MKKMYITRFANDSYIYKGVITSGPNEKGDCWIYFRDWCGQEWDGGANIDFDGIAFDLESALAKADERRWEEIRRLQKRIKELEEINFEDRVYSIRNRKRPCYK